MADRETRDPAVQELLDKQAIHEVLMRYCRGVDRRDEDLLCSVFHPDALDEHGVFDGNALEFAHMAVDMLKQFTATSHMILNEYVQLEGDSAHVESYVLASHRSERDGRKIDMTMGARYVDRFERRGGEWRIAHRAVVHDWNREQTVEAEWPEAIRFIQGRRDRSDRFYRPDRAPVSS
jgi:ketosteroid isomerase-like protein